LPDGARTHWRAPLCTAHTLSGRCRRSSASGQQQHDHVGILQRLQQALVLRREDINEDPLDGDSERFESRRNVLEFGSHREKIPPIEICAALKRNEFRSAVFDAVTERAAGQERLRRSLTFLGLI
jgi:hypothetical protein